MVSILDLTDIVCHLPGGDRSLRRMYASHGVPMAEVRSLQSQLHSVNGRSASSDRIILPLSSLSEVLGIKTVLLSAKCSGTVPPSNSYLYALKRNCEPSPPRTSVSAILNSIGTRCRIFLHDSELINLGPISDPTDVFRSLLSIS